MSARQRQIVKAVLEVLNLMDGALLNEVILHAEVNLRVTPNATLAEFGDAMRTCDLHGWLTGVSPKHGGARLWTISDAGQVARMEML